MINKLTIEQLERLKELAVANQEYGIAKDLREEIVSRGKDVTIRINRDEWLKFNTAKLSMHSFESNCVDVLSHVSQEIIDLLNKYSKKSS